MGFRILLKSNDLKRSKNMYNHRYQNAISVECNV